MSLLEEGSDVVPTTVDENQEAAAGAGDTPVEQPSWYWDENTPGQGERPQFLPDKYKSVADVAKAYKELESRLGLAPKEYDFSKGEGWMEPDYEPFKEMADFAKSKHVPQEVMDRMLETVGLYLDEFRTDINEEKAKLGENAAERLQKLNNWAKANLSERSFQILSGTMRTADAIEALEELRNKMISSNTIVPSGNTTIAGSGMTIEEYRSELQANYAKYKNDPHYRNEMKKKLEGIIGE
jgi:hypothetical protein